MCAHRDICITSFLWTSLEDKEKYPRSVNGETDSVKYSNLVRATMLISGVAVIGTHVWVFFFTSLLYYWRKGPGCCNGSADGTGRTTLLWQVIRGSMFFSSRHSTICRAVPMINPIYDSRVLLVIYNVCLFWMLGHTFWMGTVYIIQVIKIFKYHLTLGFVHICMVEAGFLPCLYYNPRKWEKKSRVVNSLQN